MSKGAKGMTFGSVLFDKPVGVEDLALCAQCGGHCCKLMSGACFPCDFGEPLHKTVAAALASGLYVLDYWEGEFNFGDIRANAPYFIRPRHTHNLCGDVVPSHILIDASWGGRCIFLDVDHCRLELAARPTTCRVLVPKMDSDGRWDCRVPDRYLKAACVADWIPFQCIFRSLVRDYERGKLVIRVGGK